MALIPNNIANITTSHGDSAGDCLVATYQASRNLKGLLGAITVTAGDTLETLIGKIGAAIPQLENVGHISIDGEPTASTPDTDDQTTTTALHDGIEVKTGKQIITGRTYTFTLVESIRDSAWKFVNGQNSIIAPVGANTPAQWNDTGNNPDPQTILVPNELEDRYEVTVIEKAQVMLADDFTDSSSAPRVLGCTCDPQEGASYGQKIVRLVWTKIVSLSAELEDEE